jgi:hypothetical protein
MRGMMINPPVGLVAMIELPDDIELKSRMGKEYEFVVAFTTSLKDTMILVPRIMKTLKHDGLFWLCYPKKSAKMETDLSRDILWREMKVFGIDPVSVISIDETWSAIRFRQAELVIRKK